MTAHVGAPGVRTVIFAFLDFSDGGAQRLALETCRTLDPARYRPALLCVRDRGPLVPAAEAQGVPVRTLARLRRPWDLAAVPVIARALRQLGADIVQVPLYSRAGPYVRLAARLAGVPLVVCHEHCRERPPGPGRRLADRLLTDRRTRFVAVSQADADWLVAQGTPADRIAVIHNGIDTQRFRPADRAAARAELGLAPELPLVLVPARLEHRKGQADLLAALPALLARVPGALIWFAGGGPLATVLPALAAAADLSAAVRFLGPRADIPRLLAAADVMVLPSRMEGLPLAVLEALAAGRPVVATKVGGTGEAVMDGVTGRLVPARDPAALATALADLLSDPIGAAALGGRGRALAVERFRIEAMTERLMERCDTWWAEVGAAGGRPALAVAA